MPCRTTLWKQAGAKRLQELAYAALTPVAYGGKPVYSAGSPRAPSTPRSNKLRDLAHFYKQMVLIIGQSIQGLYTSLSFSNLFDTFA
ncbi:MAG: hypothetical protein V7L20_12570 [Nostoc sp.]|uniref:hypothetical protein n=1 Tax=Nostoc sp. TaxID=1180 RepID=UPI002FFB651F